jgi:hypothetical protein
MQQAISSLACLHSELACHENIDLCGRCFKVLSSLSPTAITHTPNQGTQEGFTLTGIVKLEPNGGHAWKR